MDNDAADYETIIIVTKHRKTVYILVDINDTLSVVCRQNTIKK